MSDRELVDALCDIESGLTDWEVNFVEDVATQIIDNKQLLSEAQLKKAEQILEEKG